jgi:hypothetical protein
MYVWKKERRDWYTEILVYEIAYRYLLSADPCTDRGHCKKTLAEDRFADV